MDRVANANPRPRGLGSIERPVGHSTHFLLSPYNANDLEHASDLLDTYERDRISRQLEYYIEEAAKTKSSTTNGKSNGVIGRDRPGGHRSSLRRVMSMPRQLPPERDASGGGGMKNKISEKKSKEMIEPLMKKKSETKSKETKEVLRPERDISGGGGMKKKSEMKSKGVSTEGLRQERETRNGGMKKKSETKTTKAVIEGNFLLKHASMVCNTSESEVVQFGRDFLRAQVAAGWRLPRKGSFRGG